MQNLKEFTLYTKRYLSIEDSYALLANSEALGMSESTMVENAGSALAEYIKRKHRGDRILSVCGPGGKGAIGMATARHLLDFAEITVAFIGNPEDIRNQAARFNYGMLKDLIGIKVFDDESIGSLPASIRKADDIVDALVGVGLHGKLSSLAVRAIKAMNASGKYVISIDVPSGINADTGASNTAAVAPSMLFPIYKMKKYMETSRLGYSTNVVNIGLPATIELFTGPGDVMLATKPRDLYASKYDHGTVLVLGGSSDYKGAPLLSGIASEHALAALRTGAGYVTVLAPKNSSELISKSTPELIIKPISADQFSEEDIKKLFQTRHEALIIGPGLAQGYMPHKAFAAVLSHEKEKGNPVIVDATAIRAISQDKNLISSNMVITPHDGEFKYLSGIDTKGRDIDSRIHTAMDFAKTYGATLVLKGNETVITNGKLLKINRARTPALATMGTGDVLSGIIAGYAAINRQSPFGAAVAGVYVHSRTGDALFEELGLHATAYDVANAIPKTLKSFDRVKY